MGEKYEDRTILIDGVEYHGISEDLLEPELSEPFVSVGKAVCEEATLTLNISVIPTAKAIRDFWQRVARIYPKTRIRMMPRWRNKLRAKRMMQKKWELF